MKLERLLRSPLLGAFIFLLVGVAMLVLHYREFSPEWLRYAMTISTVSLVVIWTALVLFHNKRYPKRRIRLATFIPPEFREEDEGQQWINYKVTRRVYMLYYSAIPLLIGLVVLIPDGKAAAIGGLSLLGALQQILYWKGLRDWDRS
ncbi:hypothetical protein [Paenibacillus qinlingensis]|uniref:Benzoate:H+ symporter BenE n=1 Tax=Paenibacillus qinlingensis TaxID=1837343 RepID=A0ABU1NWK6_9BACL|nr:hypothetical protein [Paenibacillus qinlingensis]MDR6551828.1 putative benzoate:H+ symporter BenE [Paenibacillus qinlingensis]